MDSPEYCYLDGPHFHGYAPPPNVQFEARGGVYYYVGAMPSVYVEAKPRFARVNAYYDDYEYARPVVVVEPPHAAVYGVVGVPVVGVGVGVHGHGRGVVQGGVAAGVGVHAGVEVNVPMPSVEVVVPGVIVEEHHHGAVIVEGHHHKHKKWKKGRWRH